MQQQRQILYDHGQQQRTREMLCEYRKCEEKNNTYGIVTHNLLLDDDNDL